MLQRTLPAGFIAPCLPTKTDKLPSGSQWLHEIKHDGFRVIARKTGAQVRLYSRPGNDLTYRFPLIVETLKGLRSRSCIIDGEAVACDENGVTSFNRVRYRRHDESIFLYAFDLIELNGDDFRRDPLEGRKERLGADNLLFSRHRVLQCAEAGRSDKLGRDLSGALGASLRPAILDRDIATIDPAKFAQSPHKGSGPLTPKACSRPDIQSPAWAAAHAPMSSPLIVMPLAIATSRATAGSRPVLLSPSPEGVFHGVRASGQ